jgi:hypothetical protein
MKLLWAINMHLKKKIYANRELADIICKEQLWKWA